MYLKSRVPPGSSILLILLCSPLNIDFSGQNILISLRAVSSLLEFKSSEVVVWFVVVACYSTIFICCLLATINSLLNNLFLETSGDSGY